MVGTKLPDFVSFWNSWDDSGWNARERGKIEKNGNATEHDKNRLHGNATERMMKDSGSRLHPLYWNATDQTSGGRKAAVYLPLGPQHTFRPVNQGEILPLAERRHLFNCIAALSTSKSRRYLNMVLTEADSLRIWENLKNFTWISGKDNIIVAPPKFQNSTNRDDGNSKYLSAEEYRTTLLQSVFTLCPGGHNPESYRIFEAIEAGSIPIVARDAEYRRHSCGDAFAPIIKSGAPLVFVDDWVMLYNEIRNLVKSPEMLAERQRRLREWYEGFMRGVAARVEDLLDSRLKNRGAEE